jgi:hypothetical protein
MGYGDINPVKRWWSDLEIVAGKVVKPKVVNRRGLDLKKGFALKDKQKIAYTNANMLPPRTSARPFRSTARQACRGAGSGNTGAGAGTAEARRAEARALQCDTAHSGDRFEERREDKGNARVR